MRKIKDSLYCFFLVVFVLTTQRVSAQTSFTISGSVTDAGNGEELIGTSVTVKGSAGVGTVANGYGFYSLTLPKGNYVIVYHYLGFSDVEKDIKLDANQQINIKLQQAQRELKQVEVSAHKNDNLKKAEMGVSRLDMKELERIPVFFGERDILKSIQLLPGVKSAGEGNSGFNVRGGGTDQNLILLDEAPVYNASHLLGFFSTFNSDAVKDVTLYKGNSPAEFGGRLSSTLDIKMKEGNDKKYVISAGIGIVSSRLSIEGPIVKEKGSFIITGRRTYADAFLPLIPARNGNTSFKNSTLYFYDINAKANYRIGKKDRVFLSGYFGRDKFGIKNQTSFSIDYGNLTGTLRWNHIFSSKLFSNTSFIVNDFDYTVEINSALTDLKIRSVIFDYNFKQDFSYYSNAKNAFKFGLLSTFHTIQPGNVVSNDTSRANRLTLTKKYGWENGIYVQHEWTPNNKLQVSTGMRLSTFSSTGPSTFYTYNKEGVATDSTYMKLGKIGKTHVNWEPRFTLSYNFLPDHSIKFAYARNTQNVHQLSNSLIGSPTDQWILSSNNVKPEIADQVSLGYYLNFWKNRFEFSIEGYYKHLWNQIDYKNGAVLRANELVESQLIYGTGRAYGAEFFLKKKTGKFTGWISYTFSRTERTFKEINDGKYYPAKQDRTHDLSVVLLYQVLPRLSLSATFVFYTGNAVTFPSGKYFVNGTIQNVYTERNGYRMPNYHRLDFGLNYDLKTRKTFEHSIAFSIYNLYARKNAYTIQFQPNKDDPRQSEIIMTYLFRIVPSLTYNLKFTVPSPKKKVKDVQ
jgi:hypothetical protein